jgi:hypothetical protein
VGVKESRPKFDSLLVLSMKVIVLVAKSALLTVSTVLISASFHSLAFAEKYSPDHPVVREMVNRGVSYLNKYQPPKDGFGSSVGDNLLIGYTLYKVEGDPDQPLVAFAIGEAKRCLEKIYSAPKYSHTTIYELSLSCMLLSEVNGEEYGPLLVGARDFFFKVQSTSGGFVYIDGSHKNSISDISQTQYVMLAFWSMRQVGIEIPQDKVIRIIQYLVEAQIRDPNLADLIGGWPYHWDPSTGTSRETTHSRVACGLSTALIAGDTLGLYRSKLAQSDDDERDLVPAAFRRVMAESEKNKRLNFDRSKLDAAVDLGLQYNKKHPYQRQFWHYYYLYSLERFESFLEIANGKQSKSPDWYNAEVEKLLSEQGNNGSWNGPGSKEPDSAVRAERATCFAVLFLIRSTQKAIGDLKEGVVRGWAELPSDLSSVTLVNGKPVNKTEATSIEEALKMLEDDRRSDGEDKLITEKFVFSKNSEQRRDQLNRFARLLRSRDYQARRVAAKVLGRSEELDVVPDLIFALGDPDLVVSRNAETSLRLLSRQLDRYHLPQDGNISEQQRIVARREWKSWYLSMRPDHIFVE